MKKKICIGLLLFLTLLALNLPAPQETPFSQNVQAASSKKSTKKVKTGLRKKKGKYYYIDSNGKKLTSQWKTVGKYQYFFKKDGYAAVGGFKIGDAVYVFDKKGRLQTGTASSKVKVKGSYYYVNQDGTAQTGLFQAGGKWYYANPSNGKLACKTWKDLNGNRYYFQKDCSAAVGGVNIKGTAYVFSTDAALIKMSPSAIVKVGQYSYYVNQKGQASTGWFTIGEKTCHADSKGRMTVGKKYDGVTFDSEGYAESGEALTRKKKITKYYKSIVKGKKTMSQKRRAAWNYVVNRVHYSRAYWPNTSSSNWVDKCALHTLSTKSGNCYGYACAFAVLAREAGYKVDVLVGSVSSASGGMTPHCWVRINGAYYDPEAQHAGWYKGVYGVGSYNIAHSISKVVHLS